MAFKFKIKPEHKAKLKLYKKRLFTPLVEDTGKKMMSNKRIKGLNKKLNKII